MNELLLYQTEDGQTQLEVRLGDDTVWLSLTQMADLFQRDQSVLSGHIKNVFDEVELDRLSTVAEFATVQVEGSRSEERLVEQFKRDDLNKRCELYRLLAKPIWNPPSLLANVEVLL